MRRAPRRWPASYHWPRSALFVAFAAASLVAAPGGARAHQHEANATRDEARARYRIGVELYGQASYAAALEAFEQAYAIHPTPGLLFNLGQAHYQLGHHAKALRALRTYLGTAEPIAEERRADVLEQLADLRLRTGEIAIFVGVAGATISIDGDVVAVSPRTEPILVDAGSHRVAVAHADYVTTAREVDVQGGEVSSVRLQLIPLPRESQGSFETAAWVAAGGLGAVAVASAIVTIVQHREYEEALHTPHDGDAASAQQALNDQRSRVRGWALATDLLAAASLASCGVAVYARWRSTPRSGPLEAVGGSVPYDLGGATVTAQMEF